MEFKTVIAVFSVVFLAELGDKTQLATLLFAADRDASRWAIFFGASLALMATSALAVLAGSLLANHLDDRMLNIAAGCSFIAIGLWTLLRV